MITEERTLSKILFENKIYKANGQSFEDLFTEIMSISEPNFRKIKAWGNIGDRKNDGYIDEKEIYYQVYAPENIENNYPSIVKKLETDFSGLLKEWKSVKEFYFVINDKFLGVNADAEIILKSLSDKYKIKKSGFYTADNLTQTLFSLEDDDILKIVGFLPNLDNIANLDYSVLNEIIGHIVKMPLPIISGKIKYPDWDKKIEFNKLGSYSAHLLNNGSIKLGALEKYLANQSFLAETLQKHMINIYQEIKLDFNSFKYSGDNIFWEIINKCSPKKEELYQSAVITIMSKYFESCDIFEEPKNYMI